MESSDHPLFSLFHIGLSIQNLNKKSEKKLGLSLVQWCLLKHLIDMPAVPAHFLAKTVGVHPSTLTQTLKRLERRKYIYIAEDPKDSRKKLISLTRLGNNALENANAPMINWSINFSDLKAELQHLRSFLKNQVNQEL